MSQVWSGNISTDDSATCIQDIQICAPNSSTPIPLSRDAKLLFLSLVEVAQIPLYLAAGPSCDVFTGNETTTRWLTEALLDCEDSKLYEDASREPWWSQLGRQSENGILLRVETKNEEKGGFPDVISEILLYAAVTKTDTALPIPPTSSSPAPLDDGIADALDPGGKTVKVYALPLCSNIISRARLSTEALSPSLRDIQSAGQACFLPHTNDPVRVTQPVPQKRQSISTLFDDATRKRRKIKGRGGESVSQAMAGLDRPPSQHGLPEKQEASLPQQNDLRRNSLSRASSMTSSVGPEYPPPTSRSGPLANGKRSSLHRVESVISPRDSPTLLDADGSHGQQNKAALTKVIMAAMRLHGLQQKKRPASKSQLPSQATLHTETSAATNGAEDEYKLVYHQTFKAATFTFRKYLNAQVIPQEAMRDAVDQLLIMFCTDPMVVDYTNDRGDSQAFEASNGHPSSSPFDKPSSQARSSNNANGWNMPMVKKTLNAAGSEKA